MSTVLSPRASLERALAEGLYIDISEYPGVRVDLRYGSTNNLLHEDVYGGFQRALLHPEAAAKFLQACLLLKKKKSSLSFIVFDSLRPRSAQWRFWQLVVGTPQQQYFADPKKGSIHNYGFAIDLGLLDQKGQELDMGTGFDDLTPLAEPRREKEFLQTQQLTATQLENRLLLREVMETAGFEQLAHEWWHYDALPGPTVRAEYPILE